MRAAMWGREGLRASARSSRSPRPAAAGAFDPQLEATQLRQDRRADAVRDPDAGVPDPAAPGERSTTSPTPRRSRSTTRSATSPATSAPTAATSAPATSASTTGPTTASGSSSRSCSPRATARRSPGASGRRRAGPGAAPGGRDHDRLGPGARAPLLGASRRRSPSTATSCSPTTPRARAAPTPSARASTSSTASRPRRAARSTTAPRTRSTSCSRPPRKPYDPRPSCTTGHRPLGEAGPARRRRASTPPTTRSADSSTRAGSGSPATRSAPARVSYIGQIDDRGRRDRRLGQPRAPPSRPARRPSRVRAPAPRPADPPITKPALGISNDYGLDPDPVRRPTPTRRRKNAAFQAYKDAGVDSMEFYIRGGTHYESSFIPGMTTVVLGTATLRGTDMVAWYTTAWFDKYVKCARRLGLRGRGRPAPAHRPLARRRPRRAGRRRRRPEPLLVLLPLALRPPRRRRRRAHLRRHARRLRRRWRPDGLRPATTTSPTPTRRPPPSGGGSGRAAARPARLRLPQLGTDAKDTPATLVPSGSGDAIRGARRRRPAARPRRRRLPLRRGRERPAHGRRRRRQAQGRRRRRPARRRRGPGRARRRRRAPTGSTQGRRARPGQVRPGPRPRARRQARQARPRLLNALSATSRTPSPAVYRGTFAGDRRALSPATGAGRGPAAASARDRGPSEAIPVTIAGPEGERPHGVERVEQARRRPGRPTIATKIATPSAEPIWRAMPKIAVPVANRSGGSSEAAAAGRLASGQPDADPAERGSPAATSTRSPARRRRRPATRRSRRRRSSPPSTAGSPRADLRRRAGRSGTAIAAASAGPGATARPAVRARVAPDLGQQKDRRSSIDAKPAKKIIGREVRHGHRADPQHRQLDHRHRMARRAVRRRRRSARPRAANAAIDARRRPSPSQGPGRCRPSAAPIADGEDHRADPVRARARPRRLADLAQHARGERRARRSRSGR